MKPCVTPRRDPPPPGCGTNPKRDPGHAGPGLLRADGVGYPDDACGSWPHPDRARHARVVAEVCCEGGLGDRVGEAVILGDRTTIERSLGGRPYTKLAPVLRAYAMVYGNRPKKGPRQRAAEAAARAAAKAEREAAKAARRRAAQSRHAGVQEALPLDDT